MKILVTGSKGFIGRNLIEELGKNKEMEVFEFDKDTDPHTLHYFAKECDFVFHLAAVHRPKDLTEFEKVNYLFFADLLKRLRDYDNKCPVVLTSSIQASNNSAYGRSKFAAENELRKHAEIIESRAIIYRLTNTFGRYAKPNHHSVVATFCYNIARGLPIEISDPEHVMKLYYIDDVIDSFLSHLNNNIEPDPDGFYRLPEDLEYEITLKELADTIYLIKDKLDRGISLDYQDVFIKKLYKTYLTYLFAQAEDLIL